VSGPRGPQGEGVSEPEASHELLVLAVRFAICQFGAGALVPDWIDGGAFWSVCRTADELSLVCEEERVPAGVRAEKGFSCLKVVGPFDLDEVGVLATLTAALAAAGVSLFAISTYETDYLLVRERDLPVAIDALREAGHVVQF